MDNMQLEKKRAEFQVKLTILKENLSNVKSQLDKACPELNDISARYEASCRIDEGKSCQLNALETELNKELKTFEGLKVYCKNLFRQKETSESESSFYHQKISELQLKNSELSQVLAGMTEKRHLLTMEINQLQIDNSAHNKVKYDNEKLQHTSKNQHEYITNSLNENNKKIQLLQIKVDSLQSEVEANEEELARTKEYNDQCDTFNNGITQKIVALQDSHKGYDVKIGLVQREIEETKDYIASSKGEKEKLVKQLNELGEVLTEVNMTNIKVNSSLSMMVKSLEKKGLYMQRDQEYYERCLKEKGRFSKALKDISSYKYLI